MTFFNEVYDRFLSLITDHQFLSFTEEELEQELESKLRSALSKIPTFDHLKMNPYTQSFSTSLSELELTILAHAMLAECMSQKVYNVQHMKNHMASKDFTIFSNANHLKEMMNLQAYAQKEVLYLIGQYNLANLMKSVK